MDVDAFRAAMPSRLLQLALQEHGVERFWELREYGPCHECDVHLFEPLYTGAEGYWSSVGLDWIVYASHESSITIGGWLADRVKKGWPQWKSHTWGRAG